MQGFLFYAPNKKRKPLGFRVDDDAEGVFVNKHLVRFYQKNWTVRGSNPGQHD